jgi:hypothetical protein
LRGLCKKWNICALVDRDHEEVKTSLFESDEAYARALQEAKDHLLTAQMMDLDGINDREEDDNEDNDSTSRDAWEDVDPDNMLYEKRRRRMDVEHYKVLLSIGAFIVTPRYKKMRVNRHYSFVLFYNNNFCFFSLIFCFFLFV